MSMERLAYIKCKESQKLQFGTYGLMHFFSLHYKWMIVLAKCMKSYRIGAIKMLIWKEV